MSDCCQNNSCACDSSACAGDSSAGIDVTSVAAATAAYLSLQNRENNPPQPRTGPTYHSIILWFFFGWIVLWLPCLYYLLSSDHGWKLGPIRFTPRKWKRKWAGNYQKTYIFSLKGKGSSANDGKGTSANDETTSANANSDDDFTIEWGPFDDVKMHFEVKEDVDENTPKKLKQIQAMGGKIEGVTFLSPDGTKHHFDTAEEFENFLSTLQSKTTGKC